MLLFSLPVISDSLWPPGLQHVRLPCPLPSPGVCPGSCPLHGWCHPAISSSDTLFSFCPQFFPTSETFPVSRLFASGDQTTGTSASTSVLPKSIQGWFPLRLTALISVLFKGLSGVFCNTTLHYTPVVHIFNSNYQFSRSVVSDSFAILQLKYNFKKLKRK